MIPNVGDFCTHIWKPHVGAMIFFSLMVHSCIVDKCPISIIVVMTVTFNILTKMFKLCRLPFDVAIVFCNDDDHRHHQTFMNTTVHVYFNTRMIFQNVRNFGTVYRLGIQLV